MAAISTLPTDMSWAVYAGDRNLMTFEVTANDPVDLTQASIEAQARKSCNDAAPALVATITVVDAPLGVFTVEWDGEEIRELLDGAASWSGVWDLQITDPADGSVLPTTLVRGAFTATCDVTRSEGAPG